jgi:hypothetical protein
VNKSRFKRIAVIVAALAVMLDLILLVSGYRVLVGQKRVEDYTPYYKYVPMEKIGDTLDCSYFTGRSVQTVHFSGYDAKPDECPFVFKPSYLR